MRIPEFVKTFRKPNTEYVYWAIDFWTKQLLISDTNLKRLKQRVQTLNKEVTIIKLVSEFY